jgi:hypothetical protein
MYPNTKTLRASDQWASAAVGPSDDNKLGGLPHSASARKKVVFLVGNNAAAHAILSETIPMLAAMELDVDVYFTDAPPNPKLQAKLSTPENRLVSRLERMPIEVMYPLLDSYKTPLNEHGELLDNIRYTPKQLQEYYSKHGIKINLEQLANVNDPEFVDRIKNDSSILMGYNIRSMHILKKPIIDAFPNGKIYNLHPGPLPLIPGTHTAFWSRMLKLVNAEWTLHQIDEGIDTGPILDTFAKPLKSGKTLLQDLMGMNHGVAQMVITNTRLALEGRPRPALPQSEFGVTRPETNYSYPTHEQWLSLFANGIYPVEPISYISAMVGEYTGGEKNGAGIRRRLTSACNMYAGEAIDEFREYYSRLYGKLPPDFTAVSSPAPPLTDNSTEPV